MTDPQITHDNTISTVLALTDTDVTTAQTRIIAGTPANFTFLIGEGVHALRLPTAHLASVARLITEHLARLKPAEKHRPVEFLADWERELLGQLPSLVGAPTGLYHDRDGDLWLVDRDGATTPIVVGNKAADGGAWEGLDPETDAACAPYTRVEAVGRLITEHTARLNQPEEPRASQGAAAPEKLPSLAAAPAGVYRDSDGDLWFVNHEGVPDLLVASGHRAFGHDETDLLAAAPFTYVTGLSA